MRRTKRPRVLYTPGFKMGEMEFYDDKAAIKKELAAFDAKARAKAAELGRIINEDFERERQALIAECHRKRAEDLLAIAAIDLEEKMQSAIAADRAESQRVFGAYAERVQKAFHLKAQDEMQWRAETQAALKKIERSMERSRLNDERVKLLERGVVRGRRR
jgi:hypothetical protein